MYVSSVPNMLQFDLSLVATMDGTKLFEKGLTTTHKGLTAARGGGWGVRRRLTIGGLCYGGWLAGTASP